MRPVFLNDKHVGLVWQRLNVQVKAPEITELIENMRFYCVLPPTLLNISHFDRISAIQHIPYGAIDRHDSERVTSGLK